MYVIIFPFTAPVNHTPIQDGDVPLGIATQEGHIQIVQKLLEAKANVNQENEVMATYSI